MLSGGIMIHLYLKETQEKASEAAHELLNAVLEEAYGICAPEILTGPQGKPFLPGGPEFNISHSCGHVAVAFSPLPVGLDVEAVRPYLEKLPERIFSPEELSWFLCRGSTKIDFFTLWTLKESYYKYLGTGLPGFPNGTNFYLDEKKQWKMGNSGLYFKVLAEKNLSLALCSQEEIEVTIHRV